jgi:aryl-alcohol dehydrogenase-like predicted oxidoreductase
MDVTRTAFGTWNGGRFMNYGVPLPEDRWIQLVREAHALGVRTFVTADVYASGAADSLLGRALSGIPRESYSLVGLIGHDFYSAKRDGAKGFPRFTDPRIRSPQDYESYLDMATEKALERLQTDHFDLILLHNPDSIGYSSDRVWNGLSRLVDQRLTGSLGVAPGPANGFTLDLIQCFERFGPLIDWGMIILNPFEPWPGSLVLPAAQAHDVRLMARVVDYGGIFSDDVKPGHAFGTADHRSFRPPGWVEAATAKLEELRPIARRHGLTPLQLACGWCLQQTAIQSVVPTLIEEQGAETKAISTKLRELAELPSFTLTEDDLDLIARVGNNRGCMALKGASVRHTADPLPDQWSISRDLAQVAERWKIDPAQDLAYTHG